MCTLFAPRTLPSRGLLSAHKFSEVWWSSWSLQVTYTSQQTGPTYAPKTLITVIANEKNSWWMKPRVAVEQWRPLRDCSPRQIKHVPTSYVNVVQNRLSASHNYTRGNTWSIWCLGEHTGTWLRLIGINCIVNNSNHSKMPFWFDFHYYDDYFWQFPVARLHETAL